ncbi:sensor histidine kinase [Salinisphaera sp.]|uniref:sensor histidine kinase n=1 Tax=Salinisphaera sp. TaxID=1914330 RepID=UPI002D789499|nr:ATP-binding protein [Salinisphaera sp.]HET7313691.1 ATP-binding protein [Salinisphaera sp.]
MMRWVNSLHARLGAILVLMLVVLWASLWLGSHREAADTADTDIDARLDRAATTVALLGRHWADAEPATPEYPFTAPVHDRFPAAERAPVFELRRVGGGVIVASPGFPPQLSDVGVGYVDRVVGIRHWRVLTLPVAASDLLVSVALDTRVTEARADTLGARFARPLLWGLPLLVAVTAITLWQGLLPLRRLTRVLGDMDPTTPRPLELETRHMPRELARLLAALDDVLKRLARALSRQRIFAAAAGHELRTPLAGCRSQIELARRAGTAPMREAALDRIDERIAYMTRLAGQLQVLAQASHRATVAETVHPAPLIRQVIAERFRPADEAGVTLVAQRLDEAARIVGDQTLTQSLIDNLVRNAIEATPAGGQVTILLLAGDGRVELIVRDQGSGLAEDQRQRLFEPFVRGEGRRGGTGLGLALVEAVADAQDAKVVFGEWTDHTDHAVHVYWPASSGRHRRASGPDKAPDPRRS